MQNLKLIDQKIHALYSNSAPFCADLPAHEIRADLPTDFDTLCGILILSNPKEKAIWIAAKLLKVLGCIRRVVSASPAALNKIIILSDDSITDIKIFEAAATRFFQSGIAGCVVGENRPQFIDYCHYSMTHQDVQQFKVVYLSGDGHILTAEDQARGTIDDAAIYPREIVKRALELRSNSLIVVRSCPIGDVEPYKKDFCIAEQIQRACAIFDIELADYVIVGKGQESTLSRNRLRGWYQIANW